MLLGLIVGKYYLQKMKIARKVQLMRVSLLDIILVALS